MIEFILDLDAKYRILNNKGIYSICLPIYMYSRLCCEVERSSVQQVSGIKIEYTTKDHMIIEV